jgi:UDP-GlcNAc:undecaprenyl-phosphate GlcNAc-1-phosphate transferase
LGGVAIAAASIVILGAVFFGDDLFQWRLFPSVNQSLLLPLLGGATSVWLLGLLDDVWHLRARYKLLVQIAIAVCMYSAGLQVNAIQFPVLGVWDLGDYALPFTVLWIVGTMNAINFIDGVDGLCSGVALGALLGILSFAFIFNNPAGMSICYVLLGTTLAFFLFFNVPPASLFLGDSGTYFLGFMVAALPVFIASQPSGDAGLHIFHAPFVMVAFVPTIDAGLAIVRRIIMGVPISAPDRGHLHHRLLDKGYTHKKTAAVLSLCSLLLVASGIVMLLGNDWQVMLALLAAMLEVYALFRLCAINSLHDLKPVRGLNSSKAMALRKYTPSFLHNLSLAPNWAHVGKLLDEFVQDTEMRKVIISYYASCDKRERVVWSWHMENPRCMRRSLRLNKTYDVLSGDTGVYKFYFCWDSEQDRVQNDTDALLEVVAEVIGRICHEVAVPVHVAVPMHEEVECYQE